MVVVVPPVGEPKPLPPDAHTAHPELFEFSVVQLIKRSVVWEVVGLPLVKLDTDAVPLVVTMADAFESIPLFVVIAPVTSATWTGIVTALPEFHVTFTEVICAGRFAKAATAIFAVPTVTVFRVV
jgi:hypothetical protein